MPRPLRVLLISGEYPPMEGGVADFTRILAEALAVQGAQVHVLTARRAAPAPSDKVICHPIMDSWDWRAMRAAIRHIRETIQPDVINIQYQTAAYGMHPAINLLPWLLRDTPCVVTFHDLRTPYLFPKAGAVRQSANLALARGCHAVIVTNRQDYQQMTHYRWIPRLEMIPIGSNIPAALPDDYDRARQRAQMGIPEDAIVLCYFGFLNASKGGEELVEALAHLRQAGCDAYLLMVGETVGASDPTNVAYLERVKGLIRERGLEERVRWTGYLPAAGVSASLDSADICVLPYRDGASFRRGSFMAALAHGLPIVTTEPQVLIPELRHGENVLLTPPRNPLALGRALVQLWQDPALRARLGQGAQELSRSFGWEHIAARTLEVFYAVSDS